MAEVLAPPAPTRRERKREQLADRIAAIAFALFEDQGYAAVTMEQVATAADVAKGTLYKYFPVKEALLAHQFQREIAADLDALWRQLAEQDNFAAQLGALLRRYAQWSEARRTYLPHWVPYQFSISNLECRTEMRDHCCSGARLILERLCSAGQARGDVRQDVPAAQLAAMFECLCLSAIMTWLGRPQGALQQHFDVLMTVALGGMAA